MNQVKLWSPHKNFPSNLKFKKILLNPYHNHPTKHILNVFALWSGCKV